MLTRIALVCIIILMLPYSVVSEERRIGVSSLIKSSEVICLIRIVDTDVSNTAVRAEILSTFQGNASGIININYPLPMLEGLSSYVEPKKDLVVLIFLKNDNNGSYSVVSGYQGTIAASVNDIDTLNVLMPKYIKWDENSEERDNIIKESLGGTSITKYLCFTLMLVDKKYNISRKDISNDVIDGILGCIRDPDPRVRLFAIQSIGYVSHSRKDLVPYMIDALDDPATRSIAVSRLDGAWGSDPGPEVPKSDKIDVKIKKIKEWWDNTGSKKSEYKRYVVKEAKEDHIPDKK